MSMDVSVCDVYKCTCDRVCVQGDVRVRICVYATKTNVGVCLRTNQKNFSSTNTIFKVNPFKRQNTPYTI